MINRDAIKEPAGRPASPHRQANCSDSNSMPIVYWLSIKLVYWLTIKLVYWLTIQILPRIDSKFCEFPEAHLPNFNFLHIQEKKEKRKKERKIDRQIDREKERKRDRNGRGKGERMGTFPQIEQRPGTSRNGKIYCHVIRQKTALEQEKDERERNEKNRGRTFFSEVKRQFKLSIQIKRVV